MATNSKGSRPSSSTENHQREPKVLKPMLYECMYSITNFGQIFPNVFGTSGMTTAQRFSSLQSSQQNYFGYNHSTILEKEIVARPVPAMQGKTTVGHFYVTIFARAHLAEAEDEDERIHVCFLVGHDQQMKDMMMMTDISVSIVGADGSRLHTPELRLNNSDHTFGGRTAYQRPATFATWDQSLKNLWDNSESYFPDGTLRLKIQVGRDFSQTYLGLPKSFKTLTDGWLDMLKTGYMSDFTIRCGTSSEEVFDVHQLILAHRSEVFKNMFSHDCAEAKERKMFIPDVEPDTLKKMLEFVYGAKVEPENMDVQQLCDLIAAADKYQLTELKNICFTYLTKDINVGNVRELAILAVDHHASHEIQKRVSEFIAENFKRLRKLPEFNEVLKKCNDLLCT